MHPKPLPTEPGCLVRLLQRGRRGPSHSIAGLALIPIAGVESPDIYQITLWIGGGIYTRDVCCDVLSAPAPTIHDAARWFAERPELWACISPLKTA